MSYPVVPCKCNNCGWVGTSEEYCETGDEDGNDCVCPNCDSPDVEATI